MKAAVLDTNIISYLLNKKNELSPVYRKLLKGWKCYISQQTYAELRWMVMSWEAKRRARFERYIRVNFHLRDITKDTAITWAEIRDERKKKKWTLEAPDAWIAAEAIQLQLPLVTHDTGLGGIDGLEIISALPPERFENPQKQQSKKDGGQNEED